MASAVAKAFEHRERELHLAAIDILVKRPLSIDLPTAKIFITTGPDSPLSLFRSGTEVVALDVSFQMMKRHGIW